MVSAAVLCYICHVAVPILVSVGLIRKNTRTFQYARCPSHFWIRETLKTDQDVTIPETVFTEDKTKRGSDLLSRYVTAVSENLDQEIRLRNCHFTQTSKYRSKTLMKWLKHSSLYA